MSGTRARELITGLYEARARTLALVGDLRGAQLLGPLLPIVNPPLWELGHVAWFHEYWEWRHLRGLPPLRGDADRLYDSAAVAHDTRWDLPLPSFDDTKRYAAIVLERIAERLDGHEPSPDEVYFHTLGALHEDMHGEAFAYTRQTLGYSNPLPFVSTSRAAPLVGDAAVPGGSFVLGAAHGAPFVFDNEKWGHEVHIEPFRIGRTAVSSAQFAEFVDAEGYAWREFWSESGWQWRERVGAHHPVYWRKRDATQWEERVFDRWIPLRTDHPAAHVCWYEADAYCRWAGRRLPTESEWEVAAAGEAAANGRLGTRKRAHPWGDEPPSAQRANLDGAFGETASVHAFPAGDSAFGCRQMCGNVWEWTADDFQPYPGFVVDPYKEYSMPWFGNHKVLRGGCWATRFRLIRNTWRNFYTPDRRDVFAGFRTCAG
jgi:iron(II)-dependent oxidoreductase